MPNVESISILSVAQAGMFAVLCLLGVRSRPARNLLLLSPAAVSLAGLLYWALRRPGQRQGRGRAEAGQRQGQGTPGGFPWSRAAEHQLAQLQLSSRATLELPRPRSNSATAH